MIRTINLSKTYRQGRARIEAVRNAGIRVFKKESVLITGPSGAGKSTLLHIMGGLEAPTEGNVIFDGLDFYKLRDKTRSEIRNRKVGFVFQFYHLMPEFTVLENVMLPALMARAKRSGDIKKRAGELLDMVGLAKRSSHRPAELSGGESQRAAIARSLINSPEILLCDEPTGNLDSRIGADIIDCLSDFKKKEGMALVIVTHDEHVGRDFDKRYRITDGIIGELSGNGPKDLSEREACRQK